MELDIVQYEIDREIKEGIDRIISNLFNKSSAELVLLTDDAGRIVCLCGDKLSNDYAAEFLASIISGVFGAALEMGKILSMEDLDILQYESKNMDVVIKFIPPRFLLGVLVRKGTSLGTVRLFLREASEELSSQMENLKFVPVKTIKMDVKTLEEKLNKLLGS
jgi:predicted regulator of Ras-like GTPase activity (Roadblock/LC7/MglB family)